MEPALVPVAVPVLAVTVHDPREYDVPPIGLIQMTDPATGRTREIRVTAAVQRKFIDAAAARRTSRLEQLSRTGAETVQLSTDGDWLGAIVQHTRRKRVQAVRGDGIKR